jgi:hypothetical protein
MTLLYTKILYSVQSRLNFLVWGTFFLLIIRKFRGKFSPREETYLFQTLSNTYIDLKDTDSIAITRLRQIKDRINLQELFISSEKVKRYGFYSGAQFTFNPT